MAIRRRTPAFTAADRDRTFRLDARTAARLLRVVVPPRTPRRVADVRALGVRVELERFARRFEPALPLTEEAPRRAFPAPVALRAVALRAAGFRAVLFDVALALRAVFRPAVLLRELVREVVFPAAVRRAVPVRLRLTVRF